MGLAGPSPVVESVFAMQFSQPAKDLRLCYSFRGEPFVLYRDLNVLPQQSQVEDYYESQRGIDGTFTIVLNGKIEDIPPGSTARALFIVEFISDLVRVLGLQDSSRISILSILPGSIVITFSISSPTRNEADLIMAQIQTLLEAQLEIPDSPLLSGEVTKNINVSRSVPLLAVLSEAPAQSRAVDAESIGPNKVDEQTSAEDRENNLLSITVTDFKPAGSFSFTEKKYSVAEAARKIKLTIYRDQGSEGNVDVGYRCVDDSALGGGVDYTNRTGRIRFKPGQTRATIELYINDDNVTEAHFEKFFVEIVHATVIEDSNDSDSDIVLPEAGIGSPFRAEVCIYDFGDASIFGVAKTSFASGGGGDKAFLEGWSVTGNGPSNPAWIDVDGLYSVDQSFSGPSAESVGVPKRIMANSSILAGRSANGTLPMSEFNHCKNVKYKLQRMNTGASTTVLNRYSEDVSAGLEFTKQDRGAVTSGTIDNFPRSEVTVSMWVRSMDIATGGTLFSFVKNTGEPPPSLNETSAYGARSAESLLAKRYQEFAIHDARNLRVTLKDYLSTEEDALDHAHLSVRDRRIVTGIGELNDGSWRFLSVVWESMHASLRVYIDARLVFHTTVAGVSIQHNYNNDNNGGNFLLSSSGVIAVGAAARGDCAAIVYPVAPRGVCGLLRGTEFLGSVQGVRIWGVALSKKQRELEMQWPFAILKPNALDELRLFWRFDVGEAESDSDSFAHNTSATVVRNLAPSYRAGGDIRLIPGPDAPLDATDGLIMRASGSPGLLRESTEADIVGGGGLLGIDATNLPDEAPCVEDEEWFFSASEAFLGDITSVYDGSLEFLLNVAQSSGVARDFQGFVEIRSRAANSTERIVLKYAIPKFEETVMIAGASWTHFVVVMREDFGWTTELGLPLSPSDMIRALSNVDELLIRGDMTVCGADGSGMEVVYLQNVTMRMPRREAGQLVVRD